VDIVGLGELEMVLEQEMTMVQEMSMVHVFLPVVASMQGASVVGRHNMALHDVLVSTAAMDVIDVLQPERVQFPSSPAPEVEVRI
jgi:hypothetical protein